jgi:RNA polymerase sigma-70 factor (sigma-E family)
MEFEEYVAARGRALERYAFVLTGDRQRSQDLVQTALAKAYRRWWRVARAEHPDAYVRRILTTSFLDWRRRRSSTEEPVGDLPESAAGGPGGGDPADAVVLRDEVLRALAGLTRQQRAVLVLRHYEGYDDAAIGAVLGCSEVTVRSHATRGAQRLRAILDPTSLPEGPR